MFLNKIKKLLTSGFNDKNTKKNTDIQKPKEIPVLKQKKIAPNSVILSLKNKKNSDGK